MASAISGKHSFHIAEITVVAGLEANAFHKIGRGTFEWGTAYVRAAGVYEIHSLPREYKHRLEIVSSVDFLYTVYKALAPEYIKP